MPRRLAAVALASAFVSAARAPRSGGACVHTPLVRPTPPEARHGARHWVGGGGGVGPAGQVRLGFPEPQGGGALRERAT